MVRTPNNNTGQGICNESITIAYPLTINTYPPRTTIHALRPPSGKDISSFWKTARVSTFSWLTFSWLESKVCNVAKRRTGACSTSVSNVGRMVGDYTNDRGKETGYTTQGYIAAIYYTLDKDDKDEFCAKISKSKSKTTVSLALLITKWTGTDVKEADLYCDCNA